MKQIHLWRYVHSHLLKNRSVILISVIHHEKGSPGKQGFKMAVSQDGSYMGSIGGGIMELNQLKKCSAIFKTKVKLNELETLSHNRKKSGMKSGLICSGEQTNFILTLDHNDIKKVENILNCLNERRQGKIVFSNKGFELEKNKEASNKILFKKKSEKTWRYEEPIGFKHSVIVAGCGHVGLAVCRAMSVLDFHVVAYDDRKELQTLKENIFADKIIFDSYKNIGRLIGTGGDDFVVIVTTGFESDKEVLKNVIDKNVRYIGLMGTAVKIKKIFNEAVKDGVKKELLKKVHAPIGIDIGSDTPEEIAVSIAAEILKEKNKI